MRPQPVDGLSGRGACTARPSSIVGHLAGGLCRGREQNRGGREKREKGGQTAFFLKKKVLNLKFDENKMEELFKTNFHFR